MQFFFAKNMKFSQTDFSFSLETLTEDKYKQWWVIISIIIKTNLVFKYKLLTSLQVFSI